MCLLYCLLILGGFVYFSSFFFFLSFSASFLRVFVFFSYHSFLQNFLHSFLFISFTFRFLSPLHSLVLRDFIPSGLRGRQLRNLDSILGTGQTSLLQKPLVQFSGPRTLEFSRYGRSSSNGIDPGVMLNTHFHVVPRLRMRGSIPPFHTCFKGVHRDSFAIH